MAVYLCQVHMPGGPVPHLTSMEFNSLEELPRALDAVRSQWPYFTVIEVFDGELLLWKVTQNSNGRRLSPPAPFDGAKPKTSVGPSDNVSTS